MCSPQGEIRWKSLFLVGRSRASMPWTSPTVCRCVRFIQFRWRRALSRQCMPCTESGGAREAAGVLSGNLFPALRSADGETTSSCCDKGRPGARCRTSSRAWTIAVRYPAHDSRSRRAIRACCFLSLSCLAKRTLCCHYQQSTLVREKVWTRKLIMSEKGIVGQPE